MSFMTAKQSALTNKLKIEGLKMKNNKDYWMQDEFENTVSSALISMYEAKILKNRGAGHNALKKKDIDRFKGLGSFVAGKSRLILGGNEEEGWNFDTINDTLPQVACVGFQGVENNSNLEGYYNTFGLRRVEKLPKNWVRISDGFLYQITTICYKNSGVVGQKSYFTINKKGEIHPCDEQVVFKDRFSHEIVKQSDYDPELLNEVKRNASITMQLWADKRFCWSIKAEEANAKVTIGCDKEEIKSLLYARDLPLTETGRKRPVLHLVEAHKRRMKNGVDVDITAFLRGSQQITMDGTKFTVNPPAFKKGNLSLNSQKIYY